VLHPVKACANLNELYYNVALNRLAYKNRYAVANEYAEKVKQLYAKDSLISVAYNQLNNGKWNHMMDQTHIGYTYWQQPLKQKMPDVRYVPQDSILIPSPELFSDEQSVIVPATEKGNVFYERENYGVSIDASHFTKAINSNGITWKILPDLGKTGSSITSFPVTAANQIAGGNAPHLQYEFYSYSSDTCKINAYFSPTLNFPNSETGLQYAVSVDDELPQIIAINKEDNNARTWGNWVGNNIIIKTTKHKISQPGKHVLKYWMVSPGVVLQKLVVDFGNVKQSYLGPPETKVK
jgi:hypothetical protein